MECFVHSDKPAVGLCKSCYKAVCKNCSIELGHGLACSEVCAKDVAELNEMNERGKRIYGIGFRKSRVPSTGVILWGFLTCIMWAVFLIPYFMKNKFEGSNLVIAIIFSVFWALTYYSSRRTGLQC